jgi:hypothetical protein
MFVAAIPVLTAFIALYILLDRDTLWALDKLPGLKWRVRPNHLPGVTH